MAHFYGTIDGQRGRASRLGSKTSGLTVAGYGWSGGVVVDIRHNAVTGQDIAEVALVPHFSTGKGVRRLLYSGPIDGSPKECSCCALARRMDGTYCPVHPNVKVS